MVNDCNNSASGRIQSRLNKGAGELQNLNSESKLERPDTGCGSINKSCDNVDLQICTHVRCPISELLNCNRRMSIFLFQILGELTKLSFMPANCRFLVIAFASVALGTMATFGFARLRTRVGLITNRFIIVSSTQDFIIWKYISSHIAVPVTKGFIGKSRGSPNRGSC